MPAVSEGRAPESMRRGTLTRRGPPDNRPRMSQRGFFAALLLSTLLATPSAAAEWTPHAYAGANTIELRTVAAGEGEHWFPVWVVVIDDEVYVPVGQRRDQRLSMSRTMVWTGPAVLMRLFGPALLMRPSTGSSFP